MRTDRDTEPQPDREPVTLTESYPYGVSDSYRDAIALTEPELRGD